MWCAPATAVAPGLARIAAHARRIVFLSNLTVRDGIEDQTYPVTTPHAKMERLIEVSGVGPTLVLSHRRSTNVISQRSPSVPCAMTDMLERNIFSPVLSH